MAFMVISILVCLLSFCFLTTIAKEVPEKSNLETYIVHIEPPDGSITESEDLESQYRSFLPKTTESSNYESRMVYSYRHVMRGFAARLSPEEVKEMEKKKGFIAARPREELSLHTTHSPSFLGLQQNVGFWKDSNYGKGVIIGILDSGITPDHPSFSDEGIPPPPAKWKGKCELKPASLCNNKIIGAKYFVEDDQNVTLADDLLHGTHTASTAAGNFVKGANVYGNANGTAAGIAPLAHLAIYKVCGLIGCSDSDILAAMDAAIEDGVDVISISIGGFSKTFYESYISLGAYSAMEKGIFASCSAGNGGPFNFLIGNDAPWILTVGASTIDRKIRASAMLGNNEKLEGESAFQPKDYASKMFPLVYPRSNESDPNAAPCAPDSLHNTDVKGKTVLCEIGGLLSAVEMGKYVKAAGGAAMIIINPFELGYTTEADAHVLPAAHLSYIDGVKIKAYMKSTKLPKAAIFFNGTAIGDRRAPAVASFSSRGPSVASLGILKPDIVGPGVSILAAWPLSVDNNTNTKSTFNFASGTSMSCPHLSGVAALLKSAHPDWSPAAIKSAIMTTADSINLEKKPIADQQDLHPADVFATGAGHVNPSGANNPGLIYDIEPKDYIPYLCGLNYTNREVGMLLQRRVNCSVESRIPDSQLNYPSFSIVLGATEQRYTRTVTNVGEADSVYTVKIVQPPGVSVNVEPDTLKFSELHQKLTYEVGFILLANAPNISFSQGSLKWTSDKYSVRSPIAVIFDTSE